MLTSDAHLVVSANLLVSGEVSELARDPISSEEPSDPSEYPDHHTFYAFSTSDAAPHIGQVIEDVSTGPSHSIKKTFEGLLSAIHKACGEDEDGEAEAEEYEAYDEDDNTFGASRFAHPTLQHGKLQWYVIRLPNLLFTHKGSSDFLEIVAAEYRPGLIRFGIDDFSLSVSIPVIKLTSSIPARALMAWDRRFLSRTQHLTLLISDLRGTYPPLQADGTTTQDALARGCTNLQFKVGLTRKYKPSKEQASEIKRTYGLVTEQEQERPVEEPSMDPERFIVTDDLSDEEEDEDEGRFDSFSLSSSLESLLDQSLVRVIQTRVKYGLGWAGAETLVAETERLQQTADSILANGRKVCRFAASVFVSRSHSY